MGDSLAWWPWGPRVVGGAVSGAAPCGRRRQAGGLEPTLGLVC